LKLTTPKTPGTAESNKKTSGPTKTTKAKTAPKTAASDEDAPVETPKEPEKQVDPQVAKLKKEKESKYIFLGPQIYFLFSSRLTPLISYTFLPRLKTNLKQFSSSGTGYRATASSHYRLQKESRRGNGNSSA
jgi:hypothetical protein